IAAHLIAVIHLCAIASNTVFNLAHLLDVASNAVVAAFSKLLQFGFAISITSNRIETMTEQQRCARIFEDLPDEEKKLWHSYAYEVKLGLLISPRVPEMIAMPELENLAKSYGKFWCTWQADRGDRVPLGAPALMISPQPQGVKPRLVRPDLVHQRDAKYHVSSDSYKTLVKRVALSNIMVRDLSSHLNTLAESETEGVQGAAAVFNQAPLYKHKHKYEGYAIDWSLLVPGARRLKYSRAIAIAISIFLAM
ncbi:hypothetical protein S83_008203, partial [Arachis hypogaea]